ncbi:hypothetical protein I907_gp64 [Bacillus phage Eoghan]|uniref:Uncharacterized protein n=2 Tax=Andromedavirus TaxID=1623275 RepID=M1I976_9CAUD|nr:hypothetical protein I907_gp64 [Bacillus phage Eoghan]YP_009592297.1 hypothetical protein FDG68_gp64 [Bacillus phage Taylor]AGE60828.1 hypothetical protein EOGHAN_65 [Bacillus phage Eoghan]AGE60982.1 hypothetical protein TAYLOR_64 [Bacillus phage Taylor]
MTIMKRFEIRDFNDPEVCTSEINIMKLSHSTSELDDIFLVVRENLAIDDKRYYTSVEEAEDSIYREYEEDAYINEVDIDDVGYGTLVINESNKAVFYRFRTGYTWYVKHRNGNVRHPHDPHTTNYETLSEAVRTAKETYGL